MKFSIRKLIAKYSNEKRESRSESNIISKENRNDKNRSSQDEKYRQDLTEMGKEMGKGIKDDSDTTGTICYSCRCKLSTGGLQANWKWNLEPHTRFCSECYTKKDNEYERRVNFCNTCHKRLGFVRYNPKPIWKLSGQMCRKCWDSKNNSLN